MSIVFSDPDPNPFTPDFGHRPERLAGRDELLSRLGSAWPTGPRSPGFTTLMLGPRGSGKTALLHEAADSVSKHGWLAISIDASTRGTSQRLSEALDELERPGATGLDQAPGGKMKLSGAQIWAGPGGAGGGLSWARSPDPPRSNNRYRLERLAAAAGEHQAGVLLCLDEIHSGERTELRRLAADLQHVTKTAGLPLAFLGAGLGELRHSLLTDKKMTFFHRCHREVLGRLLPADAAAWLRASVEGAGGSIDEEALGPVLEFGPVTPYGMQLIGDCMWRLAGAPARPITQWQARRAVEQAAATLHDLVHEPAWRELPRSAQRFMAALCEAPGPQPAFEVARRAGLSRQAASGARRLLAASGFVDVDEAAASVAATGLLPPESVQRLERLDRCDTEAADGAARANGRPAEPDRCGKPMPRAEARCLLRHGHPGPCRSKQ